MIVEGGDIFPKTVAALRKVPGIGDYTAGAIASIAFKEVGTCVTSYFSHERSIFVHFIISNFHVSGSASG